MADERCPPRPPQTGPPPPQEPPQSGDIIVKTMTRLPETLVPGRSIRVRGFIPADASRFAINLQRGEGRYTDNICIHFDARFEQNVVVRNHFVQGQGWVGTEEQDGEFPFRRNSRFEVIFTIEQNCIRITVNGAHFVNFNHRLPFVDVTHVSIFGDVDVRFLSFEEAF